MDKHLDEEITIYFEPATRFAFTPLYYDPETCRCVIGPREGNDPIIISMEEQFNKDVKKYPQAYRPIKVSRSAFENLYEAAKRRNRKSMERIISKDFPAICQETPSAQN